MSSFYWDFPVSIRTCARNAVVALAVTCGVLLIWSPLFSQGSYGRILGTVTDQTGGAMAGVTVTVLDVDRGVSRTLTTDDAGEYNAPNLVPGKYTVRAENKGFRTVERQNIILEVGKEPRVDLSMQPGEQTQTVTVTESIPLVETTNATMGGTLNNADIVDLPLNGRDYQNLMGLRPGVVLQPGGGPWTQSTNGVRPDESVWLIDGVINANFFDARPVINMPSPFTDGATILPVDAIQEFNLMENPKAEYGWKAGAIVNVGIKSGTNALHGDAYAFGRYQNWDARNYFNIAPQNGVCALNPNVVSVCDQTPAQLKQFGGVVGGPIKKDKLFFFAGYEGLRSFIGFVGGLPVPATQSVGDPSKSMVDAITALQAAKVPVSAVSLKLAGCTAGAPPSCTGGLFPNLGTSTSFLSTFPTSNQSDNGVGKIDYHPNEKNTINGVFFLGNYTAIGEDHPFAQIQSTDTAPIRSWSDTVSWVYTPNSTMVNEMRFGYNRISFDFINIDVNAPSSTYGINTGVTNPLAGGLPSITISGFGNGGTPVIGTAFNRPQYFTPNPYYDFQDSFSLLKGKHAFKFGGEFTHIEADAQVFNNGRGRFDFNGGAQTIGGAPSTSLEDFFAGTLSDGVLLTGTPLSKLSFKNFAAYIQDDWRVTPRIIVNMGLRYMYLTPMKDANKNLGNFDPTSATGLVQQGQPGVDTIWKSDPYDFEPRLGLAWDVKGNGRTVVRLGIGLVHETWSLETFEGQFGMQNDGSTAINAVPTAASISCGISTLIPSIKCPSSGGGTNALGSATFAPSALCWDPSVTSGLARTPACTGGQSTVFPTATGGPKCGDGVGTAASPCDLMGVEPKLRLPYVVNYNLSVQRQLGSNFSVEVAYVGNHGYRLLNFADINQAPPGAGWCLNTLTAAQVADSCGPNATPGVFNSLAVQEARPYYTKFPYLGFINFITNKSHSNYNSAQVTLTKRMSQGLSFTGGYTYAHGLDNGSLNRFGLNPEDSTNLDGEYGSSDFDIRHRLTFTVTYNIPGKKGYGQMLEGWQINSIVNYATAQPWQTFDNSDNFSGTGEKADRWNIFGNAADFPSGKNSIPYCSGFGVSAGGAVTTAGATCGFADPYNAGSNSDPLSAAATASALAGCAAHATSAATLATAGCYVSTNGSSFIVPPALGTFGNMGRNILRDSGYHNLDMSIFKNFHFSERFGAQLRWEIFNVLNIPIAANPSGASSFVNTGNTPGPGAVFGASFLTPDFAAGNPLIGSGSQRVMQLGLKLTF
jgi:carboxypeptidase family protein